MKMKSYSDVKPKLEPIFEDAEKVDLADVLNKKIAVMDFKALPSSLSKGREFVVIKAKADGKLVKFSCGEVVLKKLKEVEDSLPLEGTIVREKNKRYYDLI
jgi:hypothetical protein